MTDRTRIDWEIVDGKWLEKDGARDEAKERSWRKKRR